MSTYSYSWAHAVRESTTSLVQVGIDIPQVHPRADSCVPCRFIHAVLLKIDEVDLDGPLTHSKVAVGVAAGPRLYRNRVVDGTLHDSCNIICGIWSYHSGGCDLDGEVVCLDP